MPHQKKAMSGPDAASQQLGRETTDQRTSRSHDVPDAAHATQSTESEFLDQSEWRRYARSRLHDFGSR
jgi:hypothetical protein